MLIRLLKLVSLKLRSYFNCPSVLFYHMYHRVTFIIAFLLLLTGAALNDQRGEEQRYWGNYCFVVKAGVFSGGAVLSMSCVCLGIGYYLTLSKNKNFTEPWHGGVRPPPSNNDGISLGRPQIPPQNEQQQPVFVPEDTYRRQQFP